MQSDPAADGAGAFIRSYDRVVAATSGGADSLAMVLSLLEAGAPASMIELHHHEIDGRGPNAWDWPITVPYVKALGLHLGMRVVLSWRQGGLDAEIAKFEDRSRPVQYELPDGSVQTIPNDRATVRTRGLIPQMSADHSLRWCSSFGKIDVLRQMVCHDKRFERSRTLVVTGERREESSARSKYKAFEPFHSDRRHSPRLARHVDHWRPILDWNRAQVWAAIGRWGIRPHPAYRIGYGRTSCRTCVFSTKNAWATLKEAYPATLAQMAEREARTGKTVRRNATVLEQAAAGTPYAAACSDPDGVRLANQTEWTLPMTMDPWFPPPGAYGETDGPG